MHPRRTGPARGCGCSLTVFVEPGIDRPRPVHWAGPGHVRCVLLSLVSSTLRRGVVEGVVFPPPLRLVSTAAARSSVIDSAFTLFFFFLSRACLAQRVAMAWRQVAYNSLKAAAALRASSREQLAVYMRLAADTDSATAYKRVLDDAGEVRLCSVLTLSGNAMAPAFLPGDRVRLWRVARRF